MTKKRRMKKFIQVLLLAMMLSGLAGSVSKAEVKTVKKLTMNSVAKAKNLQTLLEKKGFPIKTGSYSLKVKPQGVLVFEAKKTKKYKFTFSGLKAVNTKYNASETCWFNFWEYDGDSDEMDEDGVTDQYEHLDHVTTQGMSDSIGMGGISSKSYATKHKAEIAKKAKRNRPLTSRSFSVKLKKGQTIFIHVSCTHSGTLKLKVK